MIILNATLVFFAAALALTMAILSPAAPPDLIRRSTSSAAPLVLQEPRDLLGRRASIVNRTQTGTAELPATSKNIPYS